ncbi:FAD/NAD-P-binding domain-containing protein [Epithele typhae]|uniref:FAD/NAD-P-binding domain-containing protein n=1 Tax=Epithele typhae TaxID=378194 RepID=UPI002007A7C9|nr:FAD/NAD-P-binding domain-containing protein [Epithele typhae]KAH9914403.1 FAD/NAD-P-binding domain-containing protein [Epithele typhae]
MASLISFKRIPASFPGHASPRWLHRDLPTGPLQRPQPGTVKTVAILGGSYGGARAAAILAQGLPHGWRLVLPRYAVLPGHDSHKAFIPYNNVVLPLGTGSTLGSFVSAAYTDPARTVLLHASVTSLATHTSPLTLIYALGSHLPSPINLWNPAAENVEKAEVLDVARGTKEGGVAFLMQFQLRVSRAASVLVVGGGALGIHVAADIAGIYPAINVALQHSRHRLLPRFHESMHSECNLSALNVCTILGDRLDLASLHDNKHCNGERVVHTQTGHKVQAELVLLCIGQTPDTQLLRDAFPQSVVADGPDKGLARVRRTLQLSEPVHESEPPTAVHDFSMLSVVTASTSAGPLSTEPSPANVPSTDASDPATSADASETPSQADEAQLEDIEDARTRLAAAHIFAIGDSVDALGAVNAGHNAFFQGEVAAQNVVRLIKRDEREQRAEKTEEQNLALEKYALGAPAIKVSLGLPKSVYQYQGVIGTRDQEQADLDIHMMWHYFGYEVERGDLDADRPDEEIPGAVPRPVYTTKEVKA